MRKLIPTLFVAALGSVAVPAFAQEPMIYVAGPDACALVAGAGGDGGPIHRLTPDHYILDTEKIWGGDPECDFDSPITLDRNVAEEHTEGICYSQDGNETRGKFTVVYGDTEATVHFQAVTTTWTLAFTLCPFM